MASKGMFGRVVMGQQDTLGGAGCKILNIDVFLAGLSLFSILNNIHRQSPGSGAFLRGVFWSPGVGGRQYGGGFILAAAAGVIARLVGNFGAPAGESFKVGDDFGELLLFSKCFVLGSHEWLFGQSL
jgi:hypothetical protein